MRKWHLAGAALLLFPAIASAQWRFTPYGGVYAPATDLATHEELGGSMSVKQNPGFILGASALRWFGDRFGFEAGAGHVWSDFRYGEQAAGQQAHLDLSAWLVLTSARVLMRVTPRDSKLQLAFGLGPSVIFSGGEGYSGAEAMKGVNFDRGTNVGGNASLGLDYKISELMGLRLGAESYLYSVQVTSRDAPAAVITYDRKFQTDFVITGGLSFTLPVRSH